MTKKAIVIGAGAAGTSAAFRLQQAGCSVRVIERDNHVCGRTRSLHQNGFILDIGAGLLPASYKGFLSLMNDAGLKDMLEPMRNPTAIWRDGNLHYIEATGMATSFMKTKLISFRSKLAMLPAALTAARMWRSLDFVNMGKTAPYDNPDESLANFTRRVMSDEVLEYLINPMQKLMYVMSAEQASVVDLFWCAKNLFNDEALCVKGGMGKIVELVCQQLDVTLNTEVMSVNQIDDKVEVVMRGPDGSETTESADICVVAVPANVVPKIDRGLSQAGKDYLAKLKYSMLTDLHVMLKTRPAERAVMIMVPDSADKDLCGILFDHNKGSDRAPPGKGSLAIYFDDPWVRRNWHLADDEIFRIGMAKAERVMPGVTQLVDGYHLQRWEFAATVSHPGSYREMATFVDSLDLDRRVQLAGDYFALASVNSAVTSGEIVAQRLIEKYVR